MQQGRPSWGIAAGVAIAWLAAALVSKSFAHAATETLPVWLGSAITFGALFVLPRWNWPPVLLGAAVATGLWGAWAHGLGVVACIVFAGIEVASMAAGAAIAKLALPPGEEDRELTPAGAGLFIAGTLVAAAVGAFLAMALWHWQRPKADLAFEWLAWFCSTGLGILLVVPLLKSFRGFRVKRSGGMPMAQFAAGALAFVAFAVVALLVFAGRVDQRFGDLGSTLAYLPMPFLLLSAVLWGPRGGSVAMLAGSLLIIGLTAAGGGPFALREDFAGEAVIEVQGFIAVWAIMMVVAASLAQARRTALASARDWQLRYERTLEAVGAVTVEVDAVTGRAVWSESARAVLGPAVADFETLDEWLDAVVPEERGLVRATWDAVTEGRVPSGEHEYGVRLPGGRAARIRERLAGVQGADGRVESVTALMRTVAAESALG